MASGLKSNRFRGGLARLLFATAILAGAAGAWACNVPVFRFALERWRPDPYRAVLLHRGPLDDAQREALVPLEILQDESRANLALRIVDVDQLDESAEEDAADLALFAELQKPSGPTLALQYPAHLSIAKPVWSGAPDRAALEMLTDSPLRQELVKRLAAGETAVWLLLECGDAQRDDAAANMLAAELPKLEQELKLPELTTSPDDAILADIPLEVSFSHLRVPRTAVEEHALVAMLIGCEPDLAERSDPMVFPVFGRGRALLPLVGAGITTENVQNSAAFLVGACSCEVKELNPGFDLLLSADWDSLLTSGGEPLPAAPTLSSIESGEAELVLIPAGAASNLPGAQPGSSAAPPGSQTIVVNTTYRFYSFPSPIWLMVAGVAVLGIIGLLVVTGVVATVSARRTDS